MMTDPISDFLTRIRNAITARKETVEIPGSKIKAHLAEILESEGYIREWRMGKSDAGRDLIKITLKYNRDKQNQIQGLQRVSRPGRRAYVGKKDVPKVLGGLGVAILTTSRGVMTGRQAQEKGVGGEVICQIW